MNKKDDAWNKTPPYGMHEWKKDVDGAWMHYGCHGKREHLNYGWEVDHGEPESDGGPDTPSNRFALHWENNLAKSDTPLGMPYTPKVTSRGKKNVYIADQESFW